MDTNCGIIFSNLCNQHNRRRHSTETTLIKVQNDILLAVDNGNVTMLLLLDLSAAFDTVSLYFN